MARVRRNILGNLTGTAGDVVFKNRNGKAYISARPLNRKVSQTDKSIASRNQFTVVSPFCKAITKDFIIKTLWDYSEIAGETARHKIMSVNVPKFNKGTPVENFSLIPGDIFFPVTLQSCSWEETLLRVTVLPPDIPDSESRYPQISAHGIIYLSDPAVPAKPLLFIKLSSGHIKFRKDAPLEFNIDIDSDDRLKMELYNSCKTVLTLVLHNSNDKPVRGSENIIIDHGPDFQD